MCKILIFMLTYNGAKYIKTQIDSILEQEDVDVTLSIRDDGSTDQTPDILNEYKRKYPNKIQLFLDSNYGIALGQKRLFDNSVIDGYDYYAYSDHDDKWMPNKLSESIKMLEGTDKSDIPTLYFSNLSVTDENLNFRFYAYDKKDVAGTYNACLPEFYASMNTFVFNRAALDMYRNHLGRPYFYGDVWFYVQCAFVGRIIYDNRSFILFRRTGNNASGDREQGIKLWRTRLKKIKRIVFEEPMMRHDMAEDLLEFYDNQLSKEKKAILCRIKNYPDSLKNKILLITDHNIRSKKFSRNLCMWGRILVNKF